MWRILPIIFFTIQINNVIADDWKVLSTLKGVSYYDISAYDSLYYVVCGEKSITINESYIVINFIQLTSDAGVSWNYIYMDTFDIYDFNDFRRRILTIDFLGKNELIASDEFGNIIKSFNNGEKWETVFVGNGGYTKTLSINNRGFGVAIFDTSYFIATTNDFGNSWNKMNKPEIGFNSLKYNIDGAAFLGENQILLSRYNISNNTHEFINSDDLGVSWQYWTESDNWHKSIKFINDSVGWMPGCSNIKESKAIIKKTTDTGKNWDIVYEDSLEKTFVIDVCIVSDYKIVCAGMGSVISSDDGGKSWRHELIENQTGDMAINKLAFGSSTTGLIICKDKYILSNSIILDVENNYGTKNNLLIFPNPAKNQIIMNFYNDAMQVSCPLVIYNLLGIKQKEFNAKLQNGENSIPIDISELSSGIYFVVVNDGKEIRKQMFIKE
jgi:photosystem II stability/assembly factor-like uncharacterized protein